MCKILYTKTKKKKKNSDDNNNNNDDNNDEDSIDEDSSEDENDAQLLYNFIGSITKDQLLKSLKALNDIPQLK